MASAHASPLVKAGRAETPIAFIQAMVDAYARRGMDPSHALKMAQITPALLKQAQAKVSSLQMEWMSAAAMRELDDEALGWFERRLPWGSYAMLLRASLGAPTLGVALQRWCRHHGLLTQSIALELSTQGQVARLTLHPLAPLHNPQHHWEEFCVVSVLRNALGVAQWLIDSQIRLQQACLAYEAPEHSASYRFLFNGPVQFSAAQHAITFDAAYLQLPTKRDETALRQLLQRPLLLTVRPYRRDRLLQERVRQHLIDHPTQHSGQDIARALHLSTRSLYRQLQDEGTRLQTIKDRSRQQRAAELLIRSHKPIKQVAAELGFGHEKSFIRAFKVWFGLSPGQWRDRHTSSP